MNKKRYDKVLVIIFLFFILMMVYVGISGYKNLQKMKQFCESEGGVKIEGESICIIGQEEYKIRRVEGSQRLTR